MSTKSSITNKILISMVIGALLGIAINQLASGIQWIDDYIVNGLFAVAGSIFINLLKMLVVPLVTFSLICGVCGLGDINRLGRVGTKALLLFMTTTACAITVAIITALIIDPGSNFQATGELATYSAPESPPFSQVLVNIIPSNPVAAYADGNMLQIIFYTIMFGICVLAIGERGQPIVDLSERLNDVMMSLVNIVMHLAPYGVFALIAKTFAQQGLDLILPMIYYFMAVVLALLVHLFLVLMPLLKLLGRVSPLTFLKKMRQPMIFAFSTASSGATIPVTLTTVKKRLGVDNPTASFTVPFGATINMDGTAIMQGVATVFIANVFGVDLGLTGYLTVIAIAVLASIGTASVPGAGTIMLAMVLTQVGLPVEGIALILGVDRLLDMMRTSVNVTGDATITTIIARSEKTLDMNTFNDPDAGHTEDVHIPRHK